jgi:hypothetical protein
MLIPTTSVSGCRCAWFPQFDVVFGQDYALLYCAHYSTLSTLVAAKENSVCRFRSNDTVRGKLRTQRRERWGDFCNCAFFAGKPLNYKPCREGHSFYPFRSFIASINTAVTFTLNVLSFTPTAAIVTHEFEISKPYII